MAILTGAAVLQQDTQATVISEATAIVAAGFSLTASATALVPADNVPLGDAVLTVTMAVAPVAGDAFHLYRRDMAIDGANNATVPSAGYKNIYVGSFPLALVITAQSISLPDIPLSANQEFYIENGSGQATTGTTTVKVTPKTYNAK